VIRRSVNRRSGAPRPASGDAVTPLIYFSAARFVLGAPAEVEVMAEHAGQMEDGLMLLDDLDRRWGSGGELAALADLAEDAVLEVSWDTVLLLTVTRPPGVEVELVTRTARRTGRVELPSPELRRAMAVELVARELTDAGCVAAAVAIGDMVRVTESPVSTPFRLRRVSAEQGRCCDG
jgi:hypothetical protein